MEYYTQKEKLRVPEYGRNIQLLVEQILNLPSREDRNKASRQIVELMGQQNPKYKNQPEYYQTLWEHLFIISDFKLDIDSPYPKPDVKAIHAKPNFKLVDYPGNTIKYHFYGKNIELLIGRIIALEKGEEKENLIRDLGSFMRVCYRQWNDDKVSDEVIIRHMAELSGGKIIVDKIPEPVKLNGPRSHNEIFKKKRKKNNYRRNNR